MFLHCNYDKQFTGKDSLKFSQENLSNSYIAYPKSDDQAIIINKIKKNIKCFNKCSTISGRAFLLYIFMSWIFSKILLKIRLCLLTYIF